MQLEHDHWSGTTVEGRPAVRFERSLALFPEKSGRLTIDAFVHRLTIVDENNARRVIELRSAPVEVDVQPWTEARGGPDAPDIWWLPADSLTVQDKWEPDPGRIPPDGTALRTIVIEARGISVDRLPPVPKLRSPGVITFARPPEGKTLLTHDGPIARVIYRWDVRPPSVHAAMLEAVHIPWFDTTSRRMRDAVIPARRIAFASAAGGLPSPAKTGFAARFAWAWAGLTGFILGAGILVLGSEAERKSAGAPLMARLRAWRQTRLLRRAARAGDARAFRSAICALARLDAGPSRVRLSTEPVKGRLAALDVHLFGNDESEPPELDTLAAMLEVGWRNSQQSAGEFLPIEPLDG
jgi:hypothetical protein